MGWETKSGIVKILAILCLGVLAPKAQAQELTLPQSTDEPVILRLSQSTAGDHELTVFLKGAETPIAGRYVRAGGALVFLPAFGFEPGQEYVADFGNSDRRRIAFRIPDDRSPVSAEVTEIYPSADVLPENTLRFYIHFSVPMQPHVAFDYIKLRDASGNEDEAAFMRFKQELWNEDRTRLTVLVDPGRIKREVATNVEMGPALRAGRQYTLSVDGGWSSADGTTVLPAFTKTFQVSDALRSLPGTHSWSATPPCVGTREALTVGFDRSFDRHQLMHSILVQADGGRVLEGEISIEKGETSLRFMPTQPWPAQDLRLVVDPTLEDVAGNNFRDLLDHIAEPDESNSASSELQVSIRNCVGEAG